MVFDKNLLNAENVTISYHNSNFMRTITSKTVSICLIECTNDLSCMTIMYTKSLEANNCNWYNKSITQANMVITNITNSVILIYQKMSNFYFIINIDIVLLLISYYRL